MKLLLGRGDVSPDEPDEYGRTPLWWAAHNEHKGVMEMLLGRDVGPDKLDTNLRTPFHCAACNGHEGVVRPPLKYHNVNPREPDNGGQTSLRCATENGHAGVIALLQFPTSPIDSTG